MAKGIHMTEDDVMALQISLAEAEKTIRHLQKENMAYRNLVGKYRESLLEISKLSRRHFCAEDLS
jgi:hypothetical protein